MKNDKQFPFCEKDIIDVTKMIKSHLKDFKGNCDDFKDFIKDKYDIRVYPESDENGIIIKCFTDIDDAIKYLTVHHSPIV